MATFIEIARADELEDGRMKRFDLGGQPILLARIGDAYYAAGSACPHMGSDLSSGTLDGTVVTCPRHHSRFDLRDGHVVRWTDWTGLRLTAAKVLKAPRPLAIHEVRVEGGAILVAREPSVTAGQERRAA